VTKQSPASPGEASSDTAKKVQEFDEKHLAPFMEAMQLQKDRMLNASFARKCLAVALVSVSFNLLQFPVNAWLAWQVTHPPVKYFATLNGSVLAQYPTSEPAYSDDDVIAFGDKVVRSAFQLDFKNFRTQISDQQQKFSEDGFRSYYSALTNSNLFAKVKTDKLLMSANVTRKGMIYRRGREGSDGPYIWEVQYPVTLSLDGQTRSLPPQNFIFTIRIQRTDVRLKPEGIEVASVVTRDAR
jgi:intracellular multiplication protein IcmL